MSNVLVTGGAGFIGSHLVAELVRKGHRVRILDNFSTGQRHNLSGILSRVRISTNDVRDLKAVRGAVKGIDLVYHLAAVSSVPQSVDDPLTTFDANLQGTWNVLEASRLGKVGRVVFVSSASVYGADCKMPFRESAQLKASSPYAASKLIGEQLCGLYGRLYGLETVALRFFSVYGPRQNRFSQYANVIPAFCTAVITGKRPTIYGDGSQTRDFVYVGDIVRACVQAGRRRKSVGEVINVGTGRQVSIVELLERIQSVLGTNIEPKFAPKKPGDDPHTCADIGNAKKLLGMTKLTPFDVGLKKTAQWFGDIIKQESDLGTKK
ncbi:MAG: NAD-dependent epimerase/dehydratase family protein [Candidatus Zixiibacteriota bacterium]